MRSRLLTAFHAAMVPLADPAPSRALSSSPRPGGEGRHLTRRAVVNWASALSMQLTETQYRPWKREALKAGSHTAHSGLYSCARLSLST